MNTSDTLAQPQPTEKSEVGGLGLMPFIADRIGAVSARSAKVAITCPGKTPLKGLK